MNVVKIALKTHEIAPFLKIFLGGHTPKPPYQRLAARDMPLRGMYIQNPRNSKVGPPPLRNPAYAPGYGTTALCNLKKVFKNRVIW